MNYIYIFAIAAVMTTLAVAQRAAMRKRAKQMASRWLADNLLYVCTTNEIRVSLMTWPLVVRIAALDSSKKRVMVVLKIGGFFGGTFPEDAVKLISRTYE